MIGIVSQNRQADLKRELSQLFDKYNAFQEVQKTIVKATGIKKYRRNAWVIQVYVLPLQSIRSAGKDFCRFASTIKSDNGAVHFVGTVPLFCI